MVETADETELLWDGKFFGNGCGSDEEKRYSYYYRLSRSEECLFCVYRARKRSGYYRIGDIITSHGDGCKHAGVPSFLLKARVEGDTDEHIKLPLYFTRVWKEPYGQCSTYLSPKYSTENVHLRDRFESKLNSRKVKP